MYQTNSKNCNISVDNDLSSIKFKKRKHCEDESNDCYGQNNDAIDEAKNCGLTLNAKQIIEKRASLMNKLDKVNDIVMLKHKDINNRYSLHMTIISKHLDIEDQVKETFMNYNQTIDFCGEFIRLPRPIAIYFAGKCFTNKYIPLTHYKIKHGMIENRKVDDRIHLWCYFETMYEVLLWNLLSDDYRMDQRPCFMINDRVIYIVPCHSHD